MNANGINKAQWLLNAILLLVVVALVADRTSWLPGPRAARALENPAANRLEMIDELTKTNQKLDAIIALLEGGKLKVAIANAEELKAALGGKAPVAEPAAEKPEDVQNKIIIRRKGE